MLAPTLTERLPYWKNGEPSVDCRSSRSSLSFSPLSLRLSSFLARNPVVFGNDQRQRTRSSVLYILSLYLITSCVIFALFFYLFCNFLYVIDSLSIYISIRYLP